MFAQIASFLCLETFIFYLFIFFFWGGGAPAQLPTFQPHLPPPPPSSLCAYASSPWLCFIFKGYLR